LICFKASKHFNSLPELDTQAGQLENPHMVDFNRDYLQRKPEGFINRITQSDYDFLLMIHKHNKFAIPEGRIATLEVTNNLLGAFLKTRSEAIQCELS